MLDRGLRSMPSHDRADGPRYRRCSLPQLIQSLSIDTIKSINDKQSLLGADFDLIVLSPSSTALVNYGLGNLKSLADGVGVSITGVGMTESFVDLAHTAGLLVDGYTFSKTGTAADAEYQKFFGWGLDGVFSNDTDLAVASRATFLGRSSRAGSLAAHGRGPGCRGRCGTQAQALTGAMHAGATLHLMALADARTANVRQGSVPPVAAFFASLRGRTHGGHARSSMTSPSRALGAASASGVQRSDWQSS